MKSTPVGGVGFILVPLWTVDVIGELTGEFREYWGSSKNIQKVETWVSSQRKIHRLLLKRKMYTSVFESSWDIEETGRHSAERTGLSNVPEQTLHFCSASRMAECLCDEKKKERGIDERKAAHIANSVSISSRRSTVASRSINTEVCEPSFASSWKGEKIDGRLWHVHALKTLEPLRLQGLQLPEPNSIVTYPSCKTNDTLLEEEMQSSFANKQRWCIERDNTLNMLLLLVIIFISDY